jgi:hypothetical protein
LGLFDISIGCLKQLENNIFNVFSDVPCFGERRCVNDRERYR